MSQPHLFCFKSTDHVQLNVALLYPKCAGLEDVVTFTRISTVDPAGIVRSTGEHVYVLPSCVNVNPSDVTFVIFELE